MKAISRRLFGKTAAATAAAAASGVTPPGLATSGLAFGQSFERKPISLKFPEGFKWGCSTASYQIEGAVKEDGRGETNWDIFAHTPGKTHNGETGQVPDDSYHRYKEDAELLKDLGVQTYRMSIAWSRIFPEGKGTPNPKGVDYYHRVVDDLLAKGITPYVTLDRKS